MESKIDPRKATSWAEYYRKIRDWNEHNRATKPKQNSHDLVGLYEEKLKRWEIGCLRTKPFTPDPEQITITERLEQITNALESQDPDYGQMIFV